MRRILIVGPPTTPIARRLMREGHMVVCVPAEEIGETVRQAIAAFAPDSVIVLKPEHVRPLLGCGVSVVLSVGEEVDDEDVARVLRHSVAN